MIKTAILNFSGIYEQESFYLSDKGSCSFAENKEVLKPPVWLDLKDISGTNCMCDDMAKEAILGRIADEVLHTSDGGEELSDAGKRDVPRDGFLPLGLHFIDSGNYHYVSALFTSFIKQPFSLVVLDHHPDMQAPMFDILSCGGWVLDVLEKNPFVRDVHIIGADISLIAQLPEEDRQRVHFYDIEDVFLAKDNEDACEEAKDKEDVDGEPKDNENTDKEPGIQYEIILPATEFPVYLSIDKDVIKRDELVTNWDQGGASSEQILSFIRELIMNETVKSFSSNPGAASLSHKGIIGIDICGECAPDQEDCNLSDAIRGNDDFNKRVLNTILRAFS